MRTQRILVLIVLFISFASPERTYAQFLSEKSDEKPKVEGRRWVFGGDFGLQFGSTTYINISPTVGYRFTPRLTCGSGMSYQYLKEKVSYSATSGNYLYEYESLIYGTKLWASYTLFSGLQEKINISIDRIIAYSEYELLNVDSYSFDTGGLIYADGRRWIGSFLVGGGVQIPVTQTSYVNILLLYNLNQSLYTPYSNPVLRINFNF